MVKRFKESIATKSSGSSIATAIEFVDFRRAIIIFCRAKSSGIDSTTLGSAENNSSSDAKSYPSCIEYTLTRSSSVIIPWSSNTIPNFSLRTFCSARAAFN